MSSNHLDKYWSCENEIETVKPVRPHLVLVGAGASRAAFPDGDANGRPLPLMNDIVPLLGLGSSFDDFGVQWKGENFEDLYARISTDPRYSQLREAIEKSIELYFSNIELPPEPTIYDFLVLSLRAHDVIATFNWDPFLIKAWRRNYKKVPTLPKLLFLHGNVLSAFCEKDHIKGVSGARCSKCGELFVPLKLLYPVRTKNYTSDPGIVSMWKDFKLVMTDALFLTIFGYGAPESDKAAIDILSWAWGTPDQRFFEQIEIIDIRPKNEIRDKWDRFIHSHHYDVVSGFSNSWLANHPRRTVEAYYAQYIEAKFVEGNALPIKATNLEEVWSWFEGLSIHETEAYRNSTATEVSDTR